MNRRTSLLALFIFLTPLAPAFAQAVEPIPLTSDAIEGEWGTGEDLYFTFTAGPGDVTAIGQVTFMADATDAGLLLELRNGDARNLATTVVGQATDRGRDRLKEALRRGVVELVPDAAATPVRERKRVRLSLEDVQTVVLRLRAGTGVSHFSVKLEGPIELAPMATDPAIEEAVAPMPEEGEFPNASEESELATEDAAEGETVIDEPEQEFPVGQETAVEPETTTPPATTEARPPIRIPGRTTAVVKVPGRTAGTVGKVPGKSSGAKAASPAPIRIPSRVAVKGTASTPAKVTKVTSTTKVQKAPAKPGAKVLVIVPKGGSK